MAGPQSHPPEGGGGGELATRAVKSSGWLFGLRILDRGFALARTVVLAGFLAPDDFGLFGIALLAMAVLEALSETGFNQAIVQRVEGVEEHLDTAWTLQAVRGLLLGGLLLLAAGTIANFFARPDATTLIQAFALVPVLRGLQSIRVVLYRRQVEFKKIALMDAAGSASNLVTAVVLVFLHPSAWALVAGMIVGSAVHLGASFIVAPYLPRVRFDRKRAAELFDFGRWMTGSSILSFLLTQGDDIFVGKVLGAASLGLYQVSYRISNLPATELSNVMHQVTFPTYARLQGDKQRLRMAYVTALRVIAVIALPLAVGILFFGRPFVELAFSPDWLPMVPALQILSVWGSIRALGAVQGSLLQGVGKPQWTMWFGLTNVTLLAILIYPLSTSYGITGTAIALLITGALPLPVETYLTLRETRLRLQSWLGIFGIPSLATAAAAGIAYGILLALQGQTAPFAIGLSMLGFCGAYASTLYILDRTFSYGVRDMLRHLRQRVASQ